VAPLEYGFREWSATGSTHTRAFRRTPAKKWSCGGGYAPFGSPAVDSDGTVYVTVADGTFYAFQ
jgi:outer membrane protein assembly factor BamB